jgi:hypothetical protein
MARIEVAATDADVVERLALLLEETAGHKYSTTAALGLSTAIFAWTAERVRRPEPLAQALAARWKAEGAADEPWSLPAPLSGGSAFDALIRLRRSMCHADGDRVHPQNDPNCLTGFVMDANHEDPAPLNEWQLRRFGLQIAEQFVQHMRQNENP